MLKILFPSIELYDEDKNEFKIAPARTYTFEHSLLSISKWESKWKKAFLKKTERTREETIDYIKCMVVDGAIDENFELRLSSSILSQLKQYIDDPMTATTIQSHNQKTSRETMTSEVIYCYMVQNGIPFECQKWHINRLLTLINVCQIKSSGKKMSKNEALKSIAAKNEERRTKYGTSG